MMPNDRKNCPYRHENGNCLPVGGFCTAVSDEYCEETRKKNDFVSRQWLIDEYHRRHEGPPGGALKMIEEAPAADVEPKRRWIPVSEDKPHSMTNKVIVYCQGEDVPDYIGFAHYEKYHGEETWFNLESDEPFESWGLTVTHWKEKPEPPKGEDHD